MTTARTVACLVAGAAVLAACSKPAPSNTAQAAPQTNAAGGQVAAAGSDTEMPTAKPGLWEIHISHGGEGGTQAGVTQQCLDAASIEAGKKTAADYVRANCSKNETHGGAGTWVNDLVCKSGGSTMTTHTVMTMASENAYHTELTTTYDPPLAGRATNTTTMDNKWIGACPPR